MSDMQAPRARLMFDPLRAGVDMAEGFIAALEQHAIEVDDAITKRRIYDLRDRLVTLREHIANTIETYSERRYENRKHRALRRAPKADHPIPAPRDERVAAAIGSIDGG